MVKLTKTYKYLFLYNPIENKVSKLIDCYDDDEPELKVMYLSKIMSKKHELLLGKTVFGNIYQITPIYYSFSMYYREDSKSTSQYLNLSKISVAVGKYINDNNLWSKIK